MIAHDRLDPRVAVRRTEVGALRLGLAVFSFLAAGCAANRPALVTEPASQRNYAAAEIPDLANKARAAPEDPVARRELGIAYYEAARWDSANPEIGPADSLAIATLVEARGLAPNDTRTLYYLGHAYELLGRLDEAIQVYRDYGNLEKNPDQQLALEARIDSLNAVIMNERARKHIDAESAIAGPVLVDSTLAIPAFGAHGFPDSLGSLGIGMADLVRADFTEAQRVANAERFTLIEREEFAAIQREFDLARPAYQASIDLTGSQQWMPSNDIHGVKQILSALRRPDGTPYYSGPIDESLREDFVTAVRDFQRDRGHGLAATGTPDRPTQHQLDQVVKELEVAIAGSQRGFASPVDSSTAPLLGRLLRATHIVAGSLLPLPGERVQATVRVVPVQVDTPWPPSIEHSEPLAEWLALEKAITFDLFAQLGIVLSDSLREHIEQYRPTQSLPALLAYSNGLSLLSTNPTAASAEFARAANIDAGFAMARRNRDLSVDRKLLAPPPPPPPSVPLAPDLGALQDRAEDHGLQTGAAGTASAIQAPFVFPDRPVPPRP